MKKTLIIFFGLAFMGYLGLYWYIYSIQDDKFKSISLEPDYQFQFDHNFEEINFDSPNDELINALLSTRDSSEGIVCFWKGNGGTLERWGRLAPLFLDLNYDVIITDYREHGKSKGKITKENFYSDCQTVYDFLKTKYQEDQITIIGYSLGSTLASHLSANNNPKQTILIEPKIKYSADIFDLVFPLFPTVNVFPFNTERDIKNDSSHLTIITGTKSSLYGDAKVLGSSLKKSDCFYGIEDADHSTILGDERLKKLLAKLLSRSRARKVCVMNE